MEKEKFKIYGMIHDLFKRIYKIVSTPFYNDIRFFFLLFILASSMNIINRCYYVGLKSALYWSLFGFVQCYFICFFLPLFNKMQRKVYKVLFVILGVCNLIIDFVITLLSRYDFNEFVGLILGTNMTEVIEFVEHYVSFKVLICFCLCVVFILFIRYLISYLKPERFIIIINVCILFVSIPLILIDNNGHNKNVFLGKFYTLFIEYEKNNKDLEEFYSNPSLVLSKKLPKNVVIIIGESFSKEYSSLYGYSKKTNPLLSQIPDSSLILFNNVTSSETATIENIEKIMSTYGSNVTDKEWYECLTIQEILKKINYKTYWISNQAKVGIWDNIPTKYANLCDSTIFLGAVRGTYDKTKFDEVLIEPTKNIINNDSTPKVIFLHLMGSHPSFEHRYPNDRTIFKGADYLQYPKNQRETRAHYDNSIVYNDSVINEIFKLGENKEVIYFYFSDHGLDIFSSTPDYVGHARKGNIKSETIAKNIPFMVYTTPLYRAHFKEELNKIYLSKNHKFITENFLYSLMDILNIKFKGNNIEIDKNSLFSNCD